MKCPHVSKKKSHLNLLILILSFWPGSFHKIERAQLEKDSISSTSLKAMILQKSGWQIYSAHPNSIDLLPRNYPTIDAR
jgi:hypothetical protein